MQIPLEVIYSAEAFVVFVLIGTFVAGYMLGYGASDSNWSKATQLERERRVRWMEF
jgi:hypothetical protein